MQKKSASKRERNAVAKFMVSRGVGSLSKRALARYLSSTQRIYDDYGLTTAQRDRLWKLSLDLATSDETSAGRYADDLSEFVADCGIPSHAVPELADALMALAYAACDEFAASAERSRQG